MRDPRASGALQISPGPCFLSTIAFRQKTVHGTRKMCLSMLFPTWRCPINQKKGIWLQKMLASFSQGKQKITDSERHAFALQLCDPGGNTLFALVSLVVLI
eukprot:TRINITY_DN2510_c0_g1_i3.p2 TRINITY_DN2510_c0_g1~~TRINITY_DN2510_c0_g1_i3.p2  ORF type:complete len:101 (+),score=9.20 TRINITY_DN2510_c0_g1_i3:138-440(+)